ncbi:MAG TPA: rod shape-determining protein, partial [Actinomycetota bacterium]|nr:rod shape-determining protein [Actinomycetota bacterium]
MGRDLAIDLGTANTLVYRQGDGIVLEEPTVVAVNAADGKVEAMGEEAWRVIGGRSGNVVAIRPLRQGVMTEFD